MDYIYRDVVVRGVLEKPSGSCNCGNKIKCISKKYSEINREREKYIKREKRKRERWRELERDREIEREKRERG